MPAFLLAFGRWLLPYALGGLAFMFKTKLGQIITSALLWMGINYSTVHIVFGPLLDTAKGYAQGGFGGNFYGLWIAQWAGVLQFDRAMTAIASAYVTRASVANTRLFLSKRV